MTTTGPSRFSPDKPSNPQPAPGAGRYTTSGRPWRRDAGDDSAGGVGGAGGGQDGAPFPARQDDGRADVQGTGGPEPTRQGMRTYEVHGADAGATGGTRPGEGHADPAARRVAATPPYPPTTAYAAPPRPRPETAAPMVRPSAPRPRSGWRSVAFRATGGRWNPGISVREQRVRQREEQIATQLRGKHVTAFFCLKGGISKTSTTAATSIALSDLRPDPVFAIDANPDAGDLAERLLGEKLDGIAALAHNIDQVDSLEGLSRYTATRGRLTVLPGEPSPILGDSLRADDFEAVMRVVQRYYSFVQVDCGTGVTHPLMEGVLRFADTVVIPAAWSVTGAKRAAETIDWLADNGFGDLARTCIVVLTAKDIVSASVDKDAVLDFLSRAGDVIVVPADPHVADGALLDWESLQPATREAYLDIAAAITRRFDVRAR